MKIFKGPNGELIEVSAPADEVLTIDVNGQPAELLEAGVTDGAAEKHVPAIEKDGDFLKVQVGEVAHPMLDNHYITNVWAEYPDGTVEKRSLKPGEAPVAVFDVKDKNGKVTVYEYCNIHGLWKNEIDL